MMRLVSPRLMIAFLWTGLHVAIARGASGHRVFFPHAWPPHLDDDDQAADMHHQWDDEGGSTGEAPRGWPLRHARKILTGLIVPS
jgi:hypothetical protein